MLMKFWDFINISNKINGLTFWTLLYIYSDYENRSFLKSMLLNHILKIEEAGGRKTDVGLCDLGERLWNVDWSIFLFPQREEDMGEVKVTKEVTEGVTKTAEVTAKTVEVAGETVKEITREAKVQRNYKDTVSRMLFREPENALSLYNALNGTSYTDASQITFNMLDNAIYMGMQNDISFLIMNEVNLYEHQSTYNLNMPLRDLFYVAELLQVYVKDQSLYSSKLIKLPTPHFVVFYNGIESKPEKRILRLSEAFEVPTEDPELELKVTILNINPKMNEELKEKCPILKQYTQYVEQVRYNSANMPLEQAVEEAIEYCVRHDILKDFLLKQRAEVVKMSIFEYDEEREIELIRRDEREIGEKIGKEIGEKIGKEIGEKIGIEKERQRAQKELDKNRENTIRSIISICKEMGGDPELAAQKLMKNCNLNEEQAKEKVALYWE